MSEQFEAKVLILGSGPAGYTAAIYTARALLAPHLVSGMEPCGQMSITTDVENYPGFSDVIQGPWLMEQMRAQAEHVGTRMHNDLIVDVALSRRPFRCVGDGGDVYLGETLIIATGAQARWLGLASESKFQGFGVSACATCDGFFFRDKVVAVVGGGNTAAEEALYLANIASKVTLIHRRDRMRAEKILQDRVFANPKIECVWDTVVIEVLGEDDPLGVSGIRLRNVKTEAGSEIAVDGLFIAFVVHHPSDRERFLTAAKEMLRPGGWCFIMEWLKKETESGPPQEARLTPDELGQVAKNAGFRVQSSRDINEENYMMTLINR